jgi:hypothetical protein
MAFFMSLVLSGKSRVSMSVGGKGGHMNVCVGITIKMSKKRKSKTSIPLWYKIIIIQLKLLGGC